MLPHRLKSIYESKLHNAAWTKNRADMVPAFFFVLLNVLKITIFNFYIIPAGTVGAFLYKFAITFLLSVIVYLPIFKFRSRIFLIAFYVLQSVYIFANLAYYVFFRSYLQIAQSILLLKEGADAAGHFSIPKNPILCIVLIDLPLFIYIMFTYRKVSMLYKRLKPSGRALIAAAVLVLLLTEGYNYAFGYSLIHLAREYTDREHQIIERYGTLVNCFINYSNSSDEEKLIRNFKYGKTRSSPGRKGTPGNIVVIQVESMDSNIINKKYKGEYITPFLNSLSRKNIYYPYVLSYHKAGGTSDCEFSTINSLEPLNDFPSIKLKSYMYPNSFLKVLNNHNYATAAFHGNVGSYFSRSSAYSRMGFGEFDDMMAMGLKHVGWGAPDKDVFKHAINKTAGLKQPFLTYTITMTSHGPFTNALNYYKSKRYDDIPNEVVRNYFNSFSYVDEAIKDYVTHILKNFSNTYIFIWGDHTPNINTDEYMQASFIEDSKYFEFVPLIIITPDKIRYTETKKAASFLDIAPTILEASGVPYEIKTDGINLLDFNEEGGKIPYRGRDYDRTYLYDRVAGR